MLEEAGDDVLVDAPASREAAVDVGRLGAVRDLPGEQVEGHVRGPDVEGDRVLPVAVDPREARDASEVEGDRPGRIREQDAIEVRHQRRSGAAVRHVRGAEVADDRDVDGRRDHVEVADLERRRSRRRRRQVTHGLTVARDEVDLGRRESGVLEQREDGRCERLPDLAVEAAHLLAAQVRRADQPRPERGCEGRLLQSERLEAHRGSRPRHADEQGVDAVHRRAAVQPDDQA